LARLVTRLDLVDDVNLALAADNLARRVTQLGGFDGGNNFHKGTEEGDRAKQCQRKIFFDASSSAGPKQRGSVAAAASTPTATDRRY
jgi:hypothetical protein